jgi:hypothetical protein
LLNLNREYLKSNIQYDPFIEERMEFLVNYEQGEDCVFSYDVITDYETILSVKPIHIFTRKNIENYLYLFENVREDDIASKERIEFLQKLSKEYDAPLVATLILDKLRPKEVEKKEIKKKDVEQRGSIDREKLIAELQNRNYKNHPHYEEYSKFISQNLMSIKENLYRSYTQQELAEELEFFDKKERRLRTENSYIELKEVTKYRSLVYDVLEVLKGANRLGIDTSDLNPNDVIQIVFGKPVYELAASTGTKMATSLFKSLFGD